MKPVYQTIFSVPGGNCLQASLASILELPLDEVPHFANIESDDWWLQCQAWCERFGVYPVYIPVTKELDPGQFHGYHLVGVETRRGSPHMVVGKDGEIVFDPVPGGAGIAKIEAYVIFVSTMENLNLPRNGNSEDNG